jgi:sulfate adenylyltransferase subunit 1
VIKDIQYKVNINTLDRIENNVSVSLNDIAKISLRLTIPLVIDRYNDNRTTGSVILIDEATNNTVAAGMIM